MQIWIYVILKNCITTVDPPSFSLLPIFNFFLHHRRSKYPRKISYTHPPYLYTSWLILSYLPRVVRNDTSTMVRIDNLLDVYVPSSGRFIRIDDSTQTTCCCCFRRGETRYINCCPYYNLCEGRRRMTPDCRDEHISMPPPPHFHPSLSPPHLIPVVVVVFLSSSLLPWRICYCSCHSWWGRRWDSILGTPSLLLLPLTPRLSPCWQSRKRIDTYW